MVDTEAKSDEEGTEEGIKEARPSGEHTPTSSSSNPFQVKAEQHEVKIPINIPSAEALEQMHLHTTIMKELLTKKRNWKENEIVRALCDLGASINLMPFSLMRKLNIDEVKPIRVSLQLANRFIKFSLGVVENLIVKVGTIIFSPDFVILDMEEVVNASIILERPFLATGKALIDVQKRELTLRVNSDHIVLNVLEALQHPSDFEECMKIDLIEPMIQEVLEAEELDNFLEPSEEEVSTETDDSLPPREEPHMLNEENRPPKLELRHLPPSLKYAFLGEENPYPLIISLFLSNCEEEALLQVLRDHKIVLG
ncbi:uncharacterized protein LOC107470203 [Arachis duranensis]|uniref:Uncharacterized protein LOC107470203 n=1 Tax=Arachis duranensis TaxID=130453 RepID=A0A6P4C693_ARADU|nr:uncharacterized protein LOC107470203 [Arachis duranensis]